MSFSQKIKEELISAIPSARHCQFAELSSIFEFNGYIYKNDYDEYVLGILSENKMIVIKGFTLLKKTFNIYTSISVKKQHIQSKTLVDELRIENQSEVKQSSSALNILPQKEFLVQACCT